MARILVTGSTSGIGLETARTLQGLGHHVVWHARSKERAADLASDAEVVVGDLASLEQTRELARAAAAAGMREACQRLYDAMRPYSGTAAVTAAAVGFDGAVDTTWAYWRRLWGASTTRCDTWKLR